MKQFSGRFSAVLLAAMLMVTVNTGILQAQQEPVDRSFGLSASIQGGQTVILVPIWISESMNIAPGFGFSYLEGTGPLSGSRFTFFLIPHLFLDMGRIAPFILISHILLSVIMLPMIFSSLFFGITDNRPTHKRVARVTLPVWLYVSVTGVVIFFFLRSFS